MSKVNWLAGIACMASATVAGAKETSQPEAIDKQTERKAHTVYTPVQTTKMDLLVDVLKTRLN
ncbi:hypothetical protein ACQUQU_05005 [Thalassolituus sp. LLYu03]|uniref:hypothetical protein n=1 Tax=Thalassolituus sp. LLYu03 TaxID=3421656 RepID=UPI003D2D7F7A